MTLVIPEALALVSIIVGFKSILAWLFKLARKTLTGRAVQHFRDLVAEIQLIRDWTEKIRRGYIVSKYTAQSLAENTLFLHAALDDILAACSEIESVAGRVTSGRCRTWKALINSSQI